MTTNTRKKILLAANVVMPGLIVLAACPITGKGSLATGSGFSAYSRWGDNSVYTEASYFGQAQEVYGYNYSEPCSGGGTYTEQVAPAIRTSLIRLQNWTISDHRRVESNVFGSGFATAFGV